MKKKPEPKIAWEGEPTAPNQGVGTGELAGLATNLPPEALLRLMDGGQAEADPEGPKSDVHQQLFSRPDLIPPGSLLRRRYRLEKEISSGRYGMLVQVFDTWVEKSYAMKLLNPHFARHTQICERFLREYRIIEGFAHKALIRAYHFDHFEGTRAPYFLLEYVEGESGQEFLESQAPLKAEDSRALVDDLTSALDALHQEGISHGDLQPTNILITPSKRAKLSGFSHAREFRQLEDGGVREEITDDLFSVGVFLYRLLTGELPTGQKLAHPKLTPALEQLLSRVLNPGENPYTSGQALREAYHEALAGKATPFHQTPKPRTPPPKRSKTPSRSPAGFAKSIPRTPPRGQRLPSPTLRPRESQPPGDLPFTSHFPTGTRPNLKQRDPKRTITAECDEITALAFSQGQPFLAMGTSDGKVLLYETSTWYLLHTLEITTQPITRMAWSPEGTHLASLEAGDTIRVIDVMTPSSPLQLQRELHQPHFVWGDAETLFVASKHYIFPWAFAQGDRPGTLPQQHENPLLCMDLSISSRVLVTVDSERCLRIWDLTCTSVQSQFDLLDARPTTLLVEGDGQTALLGDQSGDITRWHLQQERRLQVNKAHKEPVLQLAKTRHDDWMLSCDAAHKVVVWKEGSALFTHTTQPGSPMACALHPERLWLAASEGANTIAFWDFNTLKS